MDFLGGPFIPYNLGGICGPSKPWPDDRSTTHPVETLPLPTGDAIQIPSSTSSQISTNSSDNLPNVTPAAIPPPKTTAPLDIAFLDLVGPLTSISTVIGTERPFTTFATGPNSTPTPFATNEFGPVKIPLVPTPHARNLIP
jgi:hypothetical protein